MTILQWTTSAFLLVAGSQFAAGDTDKVGTAIATPVEAAVRSLPAVKSAEPEKGKSLEALERHLLRVARAADGEAEAREIEALLVWLKRHGVADHFKVTLGPRCSALTADELLALSRWPTVRLTIDGYVRPPVATSREIRFKAPKNVLRLVPLTDTTNARANR